MTHLTAASTRRTHASARMTARSAAPAMPEATVVVLDVDGTYVPVDDELVCSPADVGLRLLDVHRLAATPRTEGVVDRLLFLVASRVSREQEAIVVRGASRRSPPATAADRSS